MVEQKELIEKFIKQDEFLIIVLDACRYDIVDWYIDDEIVKCRSKALNTQYWFKRTWDEYYNLIYFSSTPMLGEHDLKGYLGTDHFKKIIEAWDDDWNEEFKTVLPQTIVSHYKETNPKRAVVHFLQPHIPYISETKGGISISGNEPSTMGVVEKLAKEYGDKWVREKYYENFKYVWNNGVQKIKDMSPNIAITSDHGEQLGEDGNYGHNAPDCDVLREVPWYVIN